MTRTFAAAVAIAAALLAGIWPGGAAVAQKAAPSAKAPAERYIYLTPAEIEEIRKGSACKTFVRRIVDLKKRMAASGIESDYYDLRIIPNNQLVKGKTGSYYAVYLRDARKKQRFQFPGGRYVIEEFETRFKAALSAFTREVLAPIHGGLEYSLFVRGSASARPMRRERDIDDDFRFGEIKFVPAAGEDIYDANRTEARTIGDSYGNEELPYLRAAFLQKVVSDTVPFAPPTILQSTVSDSKARSEQFAEILLFVDWQ